MDIRIAGVVDDSIVDGPGFRMAVFTQGCRHACPGCHNPESHDFAGGHVESVASLIARMAANPLLDGLTLSGGDPFEQCAPCRALAEGARALGLTVWAYTGYTWDQLMARDDLRALAEVCDVVVDGRFELSERTLELRFRGSRNQHLIDVQRSLAAGGAVEYELDGVRP